MKCVTLTLERSRSKTCSVCFPGFDGKVGNRRKREILKRNIIFITVHCETQQNE